MQIFPKVPNVTSRRFARSVGIVLSLCVLLALAACSPPDAPAADAPPSTVAPVVTAPPTTTVPPIVPPAQQQSDLIVTAVAPGSAATGASVVPSATVKNRGAVGTPAGTILDVAFFVDGQTVWSDTRTTSLAPGASVTLTANGGENGTNYWVAAAGSHALKATVNSVNRISESDMTNNTLTTTITNTGPAPTTTVPTNSTPPPTTTTRPATTTTTRPASPGARQPVLAWLGVVDMDNLIGNKAGGITLDTLAAHSIDGSVISTGHLADSYPAWMISEFTTVKSKGQLYVGANIADPVPSNAGEWSTFQQRFQALANAAKAAGANGMAIDAEPYVNDGVNWRRGDFTNVYNQARVLAPTIKSVGKLIIYPSSDASFPGSYNDLIGFQAEGTHWYGGNNTFPSFLQGLVDGGVDITFVDASFHFGVQYHGDQGDWGTGIAHSAALTKAVYPSMHASAMIWPDNDERNGGGSAGYFSPGQVQNMVADGLPSVDGPFIIYHHQMATGTLTSQWHAYLDAIDAAVRSLG